MAPSCEARRECFQSRVCGSHLLQRHAQHSAVQVRHVHLALRQRVLQADARVDHEVVALPLEAVVRDLPHHEDQILRTSMHQLFTSW